MGKVIRGRSRGKSGSRGQFKKEKGQRYSYGAETSGGKKLIRGATKSNAITSARMYANRRKGNKANVTQKVGSVKN